MEIFSRIGWKSSQCFLDLSTVLEWSVYSGVLTGFGVVYFLRNLVYVWHLASLLHRNKHLTMLRRTS